MKLLLTFKHLLAFWCDATKWIGLVLNGTGALASWQKGVPERGGNTRRHHTQEAGVGRWTPPLPLNSWHALLLLYSPPHHSTSSSFTPSPPPTSHYLLVNEPNYSWTPPRPPNPFVGLKVVWGNEMLVTWKTYSSVTMSDPTLPQTPTIVASQFVTWVRLAARASTKIRSQT